MCRDELRAECEKLFLSKKGGKQELKETLTRKQLSSLATLQDVDAYLSLTSGGAASSSSSATMDQPPIVEAPVPSHPDPPQQEAEVMSAGPSAVPESSTGSTVVMFGRQTFQMVASEGIDKTDFFDNLDEEPNALELQQQTGYLDLVEKGVCGVIPLAALIKVFQGFQEQDGGNFIAVLLAGLLD